jgi:hypothetical protein
MERQFSPHSGLHLELVHANTRKYIWYLLYMFKFETDTEKFKVISILDWICNHFKNLSFVCSMDYKQKMSSIVHSTNALFAGC